MRKVKKLRARAVLYLKNAQFLSKLYRVEKREAHALAVRGYRDIRMKAN